MNYSANRGEDGHCRNPEVVSCNWVLSSAPGARSRSRDLTAETRPRESRADLVERRCGRRLTALQRLHNPQCDAPRRSLL